jgi:hypothetical protein
VALTIADTDAASMHAQTNAPPTTSTWACAMRERAEQVGGRV